MTPSQIQTEQQALIDHQSDDSSEYRVIGPPGCGKTSWLSRQVERAINEDRGVMISSLTKAAAAEIAGKGLPIPPESLGTLHSTCFYALERPTMAESKENVEDWNERHPHYRLSPGKNVDLDSDNVEIQKGSTQGDECLAEYQMTRSRMGTINSSIQDFVDEWEKWKKDKYLLDFTDLIDVCLKDVETAPLKPSLIFVDEAQDLDKMEMALIRKWGRNAGQLILVGDPDQAIFTWRGADPHAFIDQAVRVKEHRVLEQSYRVPRQVHAKALHWINQIQDREKVNYYPRDEEGEVRTIRANWRQPEEIIEDAQRYMGQGKSIMFLTTCSFMLGELIARMRLLGIPYHNPYRTTNGAWNPLAKRKNESSAADRILHFRSLFDTGYWTGHKLENWLKNIKTKDVFTDRGKDRLKILNKFNDEPVDWDDLYIILTEQAIEAALTGDLAWYEERLKANKIKGSEFALQVARANGTEALDVIPSITIGSIHSIKGGQADVVYLFPDLSIAGNYEWMGGSAQQATIMRLFYVGMTRARESLILCDPADHRAVSF